MILDSTRIEDMLRLITNIFNWMSWKSDVPEIPTNIVFEKNITSDNNFWVQFSIKYQMLLTECSKIVL